MMSLSRTLAITTANPVMNPATVGIASQDLAICSNCGIMQTLALICLCLCSSTPDRIRSDVSQLHDSEVGKVSEDAFIVIQHLRIIREQPLQFQRNTDRITIPVHRRISTFELEPAHTLHRLIRCSAERSFEPRYRFLEVA